MDPVSKRLPPIESGQPVGSHTKCVSCDYDLHGLPMDGTCPECGTEIAQTLHGGMLWYSPLSFLRALRLGALLVVVSNILILIGSVGTPIAIFTLMTLAPAPSPQPHQPPSPWASPIDPQIEAIFMLAVFLVLTLPATIMLTAGWWKLTGTEPSRAAGPDRTASLKTAIRVLVAVILGLSAVTFGLIIAKVFVHNVVLSVSEMAVGMTSGLVSIALFFVSLVFLRRMARRIPDQTLHYRAGQYLWLLPVIYILGMCVLVGPLVATVMYLILIGQFRSAVGEILSMREAAGEVEDSPLFGPQPT